MCLQSVPRRLPPLHLQPVSASVLWRLQSDLHPWTRECSSSLTLSRRRQRRRRPNTLSPQVCGFSADCAAKGLHAHHPRNCLYHLRDWSVARLLQLLQVRRLRCRRVPMTMTMVMKVILCFGSATESLPPGWKQPIAAQPTAVRQVSAPRSRSSGPAFSPPV